MRADQQSTRETINENFSRIHHQAHTKCNNEYDEYDKHDRPSMAGDDDTIDAMKATVVKQNNTQQSFSKNHEHLLIY